MKIIQINAVYGIGSTGRIVQDISQALTTQGHESYVFWAIQCQKDDHARFIRIGNTLDHKLHALLRRLDGKQAWHSKAATREACRHILQIAPDVVHLHNLHSNYIHLPELLRFLGKHSIPTLITLHDSWMYTCGCCTHHHHFSCSSWTKNCSACPAVPKYRQNTAAEMYRTKQVLFEKMHPLAVNGVSRWTTADAQRSMLKHADHIQCIYNWVDTQFFSPRPSSAQIRKKYGIPKHHKLILGVSQGWSEQKGLREFLSIAETLNHSATILLVGQDHGIPQTANLRCIGFTSDRQELAELYSAADLFLNPSRAETFGLVTAEAMACGTPVVAYDNSGSSELVPEQCGALAPDGDLAALTEQVKKVLCNGKASYTAACRQWVCDNFDKEKQVRKYLDLYTQLAEHDKDDHQIRNVELL